MSTIAPPTPHCSAAILIGRLRAARERIIRAGTAPGEDSRPVGVFPTGMARDRGEALRDLLIAEHAHRCVETGFAFAMSSSFILEALLSDESADEVPEGSKLVSIDPFQSNHWKGAGRCHLREAGAAHLHTLIEERSEVVLPRLIAEGEHFDAAFIDGDHRFEGVFLDVFFARRLVSPGNLIILDDAWMPAARKAAAFFESAGLCKVVPTPAASPLAKFILLRVTPEGDQRAWDHFAEF